MPEAMSNSGRVICGIDEAGRGPVLGPMVMSMVCADQDMMRSLGMRDSKLLSPARREHLFGIIMEKAERVEHVVIHPPELNSMMDGKTLNEIELEHAVMLASGASGDVVVDCFDVNEGRASRRMSEMTGKNVKCIHKADRDYAVVSAASIVSKVIRDREIERIREKFGDVGSGYPADPRTREFLENAIRNRVDISSIVRTHWSTYVNIRKKAGTGKLF